MKPTTFPKVENRQNRHDPNLDRCRELLAWFIRCARRVRPADAVPWSEVLVLLVGHAASAGAHRAVFGDDDPTDVITMTYAPMPGMDVGASGELVVNIERAVEEGTRRSRNGWTPAHELALYIAHGVDHLTGADDANPADRRRMRARELTWVRSAERRGLLRNLLRVEA
jgi:rRNA maturation RNase YbeY